MLSNVKALAHQHKATIDWRRFADDVEDYLDGASQDNWRRIFRPLVQGVVTNQVNRWSNTLGIKWDVQNLFARDWFNRYLLKFAQEIGKTTKEYVAKTINQAISEGWSIPQMQNNLTDLFGLMAKNDPDNLPWYFDRLPKYRTEMIARTETIRASNAGTVEQFGEWGVERHEWLSTKDDRTRNIADGAEFDHVDMDKQVVAIGELFQVPMKGGGTEGLEYPGDPSGSPGNTINCRCTTIPIIEGMEGGGGE